jgi:hypothetical protein
VKFELAEIPYCNNIVPHSPLTPDSPFEIGFNLPPSVRVSLNTGALPGPNPVSMSAMAILHQLKPS